MFSSAETVTANPARTCTYVRIYGAPESSSAEKLFPAGNSTYVRTYVHIPAWKAQSWNTVES